MYEIYKFQKGDTLEKIATDYRTSCKTLRDVNNSSNFSVGDNIVVPKKNEYFEYYTIKKGDSLYQIAREYNTDYNLLALLNGLNIYDYIYPNTTILVPKKDIKYYITKDNDTLEMVNKMLSSDINRLLNQNESIYLKEGQLIVYKD